MQDLPITALTQSGVPIRTRDVIVIRVFNSVSTGTIQFGGRVLDERGVQVDINEQHAIAVSGAAQEFTVNLLNGWLMSFQCNAQEATFAQGTMYIEAFLSFGSGSSTQRYRTLFTGYLNPKTALAWPRVYRILPGEGPGDILTFNTPNPAAGAEIASGSLAEGKWRFQTMSFQLVTDATVANRRVSLEVLEDGGGTVAQIPVNVAQTASLTWRYSFGVALHAVNDTTHGFISASFPDMLMNGDYEINTVTQNLQAGDDFSVLTATTEFWGSVAI